MSRRIRIPDRVIVHKSKSIPRLCALTAGRHNRVGLRETAQRRVKPTRLEPIDSKTRLLALPGESIVGPRPVGQAAIAHLAIGLVAQLAGLLLQQLIEQVAKILLRIPLGPVLDLNYSISPLQRQVKAIASETCFVIILHLPCRASSSARVSWASNPFLYAGLTLGFFSSPRWLRIRF